MIKITPNAAFKHLQKSDPVMAGLVNIHGPSLANIYTRNRTSSFHILIRTIINQQLSIKAGQTIVSRLLEKQGGKSFKADNLHQLKDHTLRNCGISENKLHYIRTLAEAVINGELNFRLLKTLDDDAIIGTLIKYPGIGPWTAELFLINALHRPDILPLGDLILRKSMQRHYQLSTDTKEHIYREIAEAWRPYRTIASQFLWSGF